MLIILKIFRENFGLDFFKDKNVRLRIIFKSVKINLMLLINWNKYKKVILILLKLFRINGVVLLYCIVYYFMGLIDLIVSFFVKCGFIF